MWTWYLHLPPTLAGSSESVTEPLLKETVRAHLALAASCSEYLPKDVFHSQPFFFFFFPSNPLGYLQGITLMSCIVKYFLSVFLPERDVRLYPTKGLVLQ